MSKKRMYVMDKVTYAELLCNDGKKECVLKVYWKATKHNPVGADCVWTYVVKSLEDAQNYVDTLVKKLR